MLPSCSQNMGVPYNDNLYQIQTPFPNDYQDKCQLEGDMDRILPEEIKTIAAVSNVSMGETTNPIEVGYITSHII